MSRSVLSLEENSLNLFYCVIAFHIFVDGCVGFFCDFLESIVRVDLIRFIHDFSFVFVELFRKLFDSDGNILKIFDKLLYNFSGVEILTCLTLTSHQFIHSIIEVVHVPKGHFCNFQAKRVRVDKGVIVFVLVGVEQRFEKILDLLVDLVNFILDFVDHLLLSCG
jgi:hypothetical protein